MSTLQLILLDEGDESQRSRMLLGPLPAKVRGSDSSGKEFEIETILANFSASHLCLELDNGLEVTGKLFIVTKIHHARVAIRGRVLRRDQISQHRSRLEVAITNYRFLQN